VIIRLCTVLPLILALSGLPASAGELSAEAINNAHWRGVDRDEAFLAKAQILLDRARFSPGEIDGRTGDNYSKALAAYAQQRGIETRGEMTEPLWRELLDSSSEPIIVPYTLAEKDVKGPFLEKVPTKLDDMKGLNVLAYGGPREALAERFHMSEDLLSKLNPGQKFDRAGTVIQVVKVAERSARTKAAKVEVDKSAQTLKAFDQQGKLIAFLPVTAGSSEKPAPSGELKVRSVAKNPTYRYNPDYEFKGVRSKEPLTVAAGPNNPVGLVWIGLPGEGYGLHGTPEPSKIGKTDSHGCIRLTNWDALQLAEMVTKGTPVTFIGDDSNKKNKKAPRKKRRRG
jgi:lipoprotein-anchoring transpeptidase ErfK/SrfK